jgi:hypothetical protein
VTADELHELMADEVRALTANEVRAALIAMYRRRTEGTIVPRFQGSFEDWTPLPNSCHDNVLEWVQRVPQHKAVFGFLYFDFGGYFASVRFLPHSVVETEDGSLADITPQQRLDAHPSRRQSLVGIGISAVIGTRTESLH